MPTASSLSPCFFFRSHLSFFSNFVFYSGFSTTRMSRSSIKIYQVVNLSIHELNFTFRIFTEIDQSLFVDCLLEKLSRLLQIALIKRKRTAQHSESLQKKYVLSSGSERLLLRMLASCGFLTFCSLSLTNSVNFSSQIRKGNGNESQAGKIKL